LDFEIKVLAQCAFRPVFVLSGAPHVLISLISTLRSGSSIVFPYTKLFINLKKSFSNNFLHFAYVKYLDQRNSLTKVFIRSELLFESFLVLTHSVYIVANSDDVLHNFSYFPDQQLIFLTYPLLRTDNLTDKMEDHYEDHVNGTDILGPLPKNNRIFYQMEYYEYQNCLCL